MRKVSLIISILFSSMLLRAQTGVGDNFETNTGTSLSSGWATNSQYSIIRSPNSTTENNIMYVSYGKANNYSGFTYSFSPINITDAPFVSISVKSSKAFTMRVDLIDINNNKTNLSVVNQTIKADNANYIDYLFDFAGKFKQSYPTSTDVDMTNIKQIEIYVNAGSQTSSSGVCFLDNVMIGTSAKVDYVLGSKDIKLNQLGFFQNGPKQAVVKGGTSQNFYIVSNSLKDTLYTGTLSQEKNWVSSTQKNYSNESVRIADFTNFKTVGTYKLRIPGVSLASYPFTISETPLNTISKASVKGFYYQRASTALPVAYAGQWSRETGHADNQVLIHNSAASPGRPTGAKISSPRGWYDAGDYNKYIVNSGISTYTLLASYEHFSTYYDTLNLNIPESSNSIPDILDEALYNIRWMLTMQDPYDGGVYHKLTNANFDGDYVMPSSANNPRYVVQKSTGATLDFAAVMAQSARIYSQFSAQLPGFADSCLRAATNAYDWSISNPDVFYKQNDLTPPKITTGTYDDWSFIDEFNWAAAELYTTTQLPKYFNAINLTLNADIPGWQSVNTLGLISLAHNRVVLGDEAFFDQVQNKIIGAANAYRNHALNSSTGSAYGVAMGTYDWNFGWGSNSSAANQSMILIQAFNYTKDSTYLKAAVSNVDYLLGRNGVGYSFVTGYGSYYSNKPHHRVSQADGVQAAVPGLLVGGPNPGQQDKSTCPNYPSTLPALSYQDAECSYSTNEIAINWNAPLAYITGAIQSIYSGIESSERDYTVDVPTSTKNAILKNIVVKVYPNPTSSMLNIDKPFELVSAPIVLDLNGNEHTVTSDWSGNTIQMNTNELQEGLYLIRLQGENGAAIQKFTVIK